MKKILFLFLFFILSITCHLLAFGLDEGIGMVQSGSGGSYTPPPVTGKIKMFSTNGEVTLVASEAVVLFSSPAANITEIDFPDNETSIGDSAFSGYSKLTRVNMPKSTGISNYAFNDCVKLNDVNVSSATVSHPIMDVHKSSAEANLTYRDMPK